MYLTTEQILNWAQAHHDLAKSSLAKLLANVRSGEGLPTMEQILAWADEHNARTGAWPTENDGSIPGSIRPILPRTKKPHHFCWGG
jgi:hypothetical protein